MPGTSIILGFQITTANRDQTIILLFKKEYLVNCTQNKTGSVLWTPTQNHFYSGKAAVCSVYIVELQVTVKNIKQWVLYNNASMESKSQAKIKCTEVLIYNADISVRF